MPCITPNHDGAVILGEDLLNLLIGKFYAGRPQLFRRISKGMGGRTPFDPVLDPLKIGETGHAIEYEFAVTAPPDGKFIDLFPAQDPRTGISAQSGELLFKAGALVRLWDPLVNKRWQFGVPLTVACTVRAAGEDEVFEGGRTATAGFLPPPMQNAIDYALGQLVHGALKRMTLPGNFLFAPPASVHLHIEALTVDSDLLRIDAGISF